MDSCLSKLYESYKGGLVNTLLDLLGTKLSKKLLAKIF